MYWCVTREFRGDGTAKADMTCRVCGEKPENKAMRIYRLDHFEDWFEDRKEAEAFLAAAWAEIGEKAA
jgi:uncharacterized protein involved in copper resistance